MKIKDQNHIEKKCPDGIIRECCYDEKSHKFVPPDNKAITTSEVCGICAVLKEKIDFWKRQFDLEVAGRRKAEVELEKRPEVVRCGECKKWQTENCLRRKVNYDYKEGFLYFYPEKYGYCEHGQRKEAKDED